VALDGVLRMSEPPRRLSGAASWEGQIFELPWAHLSHRWVEGSRRVLSSASSEASGPRSCGLWGSDWRWERSVHPADSGRFV
jgi:hypothetical protein